MERLKEDVGPIMFYQSGGCCDGSLPICFKLDEFITSDNDILLGRIDDIPIYIDNRQYEVWRNSQLIIDVAPGDPEGFSIAAGDNLHFVTKSKIVNLEFVMK